jgi:predicted site-specific integrase-resolvase
VPARKAGPRTILVDTAAGDSGGAVSLCARVSSHDQREDLGRQAARISEWAMFSCESGQCADGLPKVPVARACRQSRQLDGHRRHLTSQVLSCHT